MEKQLAEELYDRFYKEIYLYLLSLCKNVHVAEDLSQETFLKALLSLRDSHTNIRAWLYTVARNLYFNYRKKDSKVTLVDEFAEETLGEGADNLLSRLIDGENNRMLYKALGKINDRYREVLTLQYFGGLSQQEIGRMLKISLDNVRILTYRGKQQLKKELEALKYEI